MTFPKALSSLHRRRAGLAGLAVLIFAGAAYWLSRTVGSRAGEVGNPLTRENSLRAAVRSEPADAHARLDLISFLLGSGRSNDALDEARNAHAALPGAPALTEALARSLAATGRLPEAIALMRPLARLNVDDRLDLAAYLIRSGQRSAAVGLLQGLSLTDTQTLRAGQLYLDALQPAEAASVLRGVAERNPGSRDLRTVYGLALLISGRSGEAAPVLDALAHSPPDMAILHHYAGVAIRLTADLKRLPDAESHLGHAAEAEPEEGLFHYELGLALVQLRAWDDARASLDKAASLDPTNPETQRDQARVYRHLEKPVESELAQARYLRLLDDASGAASVLTRLYSADRGNVEVGLALSNAEYARGKFDRALSILREGLKKAPGETKLQWGLVRLLGSLERYGEALRAVGALEASAPKDLLVLEEKARLLEALARYPQAEKVLAQLRDLEPQNAARHARLGVLLALNSSPERYRDAEQSLRTALGLDPEQWNALYGMGLVLGSTHRLPEAISYLRRALDQQPRSQECLRLLGRAYAEAGNASASTECFQLLRRLQAEAAELARLRLPVNHLKDLRTSRMALARYYLDHGDLITPIQELEALEHEFPNETEASRLLERLYGHARRWQRYFEEHQLLETRQASQRSSVQPGTRAGTPQ